MKIVFLLSAGVFFCFNGFAGGPNNNIDESTWRENFGDLSIRKDIKSISARIAQENPGGDFLSWSDRLNSPGWQQRMGAVKGWKEGFSGRTTITIRQILSYLILGLNDRSKKVREALPAVFTEIVGIYPAVVAVEIIDIVLHGIRDDSRSDIFALIEAAGKKGLSSADYNIRLKTIALLTKMGTRYPSTSSDITLIISSRQEKEQSHRVKMALKKSRKALQRPPEQSACRETLST